ncbi:MAG: GNAT family N-acetyltransferase [Parvularculaceae bacterium]|nr:GNAT family N-acetyltransferase [Parvularculaceae bacterium]
MTTIRPLTRADEAGWRPLWRGYLEFYKAALDKATTTKTFERLVGDPRFFAFVADREGALVGVVHCIIHPATWSIRDYCYLEDLFVQPVERGKGTGRALIEAVYSEARRRSLDRVYWLTHETNAAGRALYGKLASFDGFIQYRRKL